MKQALYLLASKRIQDPNRSLPTYGGLRKRWSLCWAYKGGDDCPDLESIEEADLPDVLEEAAAAMVDRDGWKRV